MPDISLSAGVDTSGVSTGMAAIKNEVAQTGQSIATSFAGVFSPSGHISAAITGFIAGGFKELLERRGRSITKLSDSTSMPNRFNESATPRKKTELAWSQLLAH